METFGCYLKHCDFFYFAFHSVVEEMVNIEELVEEAEDMDLAEDEDDDDDEEGIDIENEIMNNGDLQMFLHGMSVNYFA